VVYRFIELSLGLESDIEIHEERFARRIRRHVLEPAKRLVTEVRDLGIETCILRPGEEVPSAELDPCRARLAVEQCAGHARGQLIPKAKFAELDEAAVLNVNRIALRERKRALRSNGCIAEQ